MLNEADIERRKRESDPVFPPRDQELPTFRISLLHLTKNILHR